MDSLTQIVLGAACGEAVLGKKVGNKAILWGAVAGTIPDLDVFPGMLMETVDRLTIHRGFSHSVLFDLLVAPLLGYLIFRIYKGRQGTWKDWTLLSFWGLFTHPLLDCFTTWGTQLFWPFEYRVAINSIFVADPLYTVPFMVCVIWVMFYKRERKSRRLVNWMGLIYSTGYLAFTLLNQQIINKVIENSLSEQGIEYKRYACRPTPLNQILWAANVETDSSFLIGYYGHLDQDKKVKFRSFRKNTQLLEPWANEERVQRLLRMTTGYYTVEKTDSGLAINDLRFGELLKEDGESDRFVFVYTLNPERAGPKGKPAIGQPEKNMDDASKIFKRLLKRVGGNR